MLNFLNEFFVSRDAKTVEKRLYSLKMPWAENACSAVANHNSALESQNGGKLTFGERWECEL